MTEKPTDMIVPSPPSPASLDPCLSWSSELFEEITDRLAEALYKDFQEHRSLTVQSPQGPNHAALLTPVANEDK